jgi:molybdate transport system substrate-binding protein
MGKLTMSRLVSIAAVVCATWLGGAAAFAQAGAPVTVFAAASLKNALDEAVAIHGQRTGTRVTVSYAASSALARQIEAGAPADLFISADLDWMDYLQTRQLIRPATRVNLLGNRLVLIAPRDSKASLTVERGLPLARALGDGRLAVADPDAVPAGKYAKAALEALGAWSAVAPRLARAENVRAALAFVARGECPLGIVYATDAAAEARVRIVGAFPAGTHPPIVYPAAITATAKSAGAASLLQFLGSAAAKPVFEKHGFTVLE